MTPGLERGKGARVKTLPSVSSELDVALESIPSSSFSTLGLSEAILEALTSLGFTDPTPIQKAAIPPLLAGKDVIGRARTGTGKTAAFGLPLIERLGGERTGRPRALVLAPTRELALQVAEALRTFSVDNTRLTTVYGGAPYGAQLRALREGVEIVVGTPGRVIDLMERGSLDLSHLEMLVLDEADEMLKMGFIEDVEHILGATPETRQVALFSATMPDPIRRIAERWLRSPEHAVDSKGSDVPSIEQRYVQVPSRFKREALIRVLQAERDTAAIVFAATKVECDEVAHALMNAGFQAEALHGDLSQPAREKVVAKLREKRLNIVVATDIAARGIDIDHLSLIVNLEVPKNFEIYTHRIGRTGRAGRKGRAITMLTPREVQRFVQTLTRSGANVSELFLPSERALVELRREWLIGEIKGWKAAEDPERTVVAEWVSALTSEGLSLEDLAIGALGLLAESRHVSLSEDLDSGVPPWARQAGVLKRDGKREPLSQDQNLSSPELWVRIEVGRAHNTLPADLVGALANEIGLPGPKIGRIVLRERDSFIQVPREFAERLGQGSWPIQVRRHETSLSVPNELPEELERTPRARVGHGVPPRPAPRPSDARFERGAPGHNRFERDERHHGGGRFDRSQDDRGASRPARGGFDRQAPARDERSAPRPEARGFERNAPPRFERSAPQPGNFSRPRVDRGFEGGSGFDRSGPRDGGAPRRGGDKPPRR